MSRRRHQVTKVKKAGYRLGTAGLHSSQAMQTDSPLFVRGQCGAEPPHIATFYRKQTELILNAAGEGIYGLDLHGRVTFANPAAAAMTGHTVAELLGQGMHDLVHHSSAAGDPVPRECCAIYAAFKDGRVHHEQEDVFWRKDGSCFPVEYTSTPIREDHELVGAVVVFSDITERKRSLSRLERALSEVERLKEKLQHENAYLKQEIRKTSGPGTIVGSSYALRSALEAVKRVAPTDATVLIQGETGTGKELIAQAVHRFSSRRDGPMVKLNCGALPKDLVESELFGHERGAFTGAVERRQGRFELADGGTLFLDEVGELPLPTQASLLRALQEGEFERVGGTRTLKTDVRVIAATHRNLARLVEEGRFRADLYYRLNVFPIALPPLRERRRDIPELVAAFLEQLSKRLGRTLAGVSEESMRRLQAYPFPGNVRELQNVLERAAILATGPVIEVDPLSVRPPVSSGPALPEATLPTAPVAAEAHADVSLEAHERSLIMSVLRARGWKIAGRDGAAEALGLHPNTLRSRMQRLRIPTRTDARKGNG